MSRYMAYSKNGTEIVDTIDFYKKFNVTIGSVSRAAGISRTSVSRVPSDCASAENTKKVILYLEKISILGYESEIQRCRKEVQNALKQMEIAWQNYEERECVLENYRKRYNISRDKPLAIKVDSIDVFEEKDV